MNSVSLIHAGLIEIFGKQFVNQGAPIDVAPEDNPANEPEPDVIVLNRDYFTFLSANPGPPDLRLVVEVADSSLCFDLANKAAIYARAGILEYWVLDVPGRRLIVHRSPELRKYTFVVAYSKNESIAPLSAPEAALRVRDAFPE